MSVHLEGNQIRLLVETLQAIAIQVTGLDKTALEELIDSCSQSRIRVCYFLECGKQGSSKIRE